MQMGWMPSLQAVQLVWFPAKSEPTFLYAACDVKLFSQKLGALLFLGSFKVLLCKHLEILHVCSLTKKKRAGEHS